MSVRPLCRVREGEVLGRTVAISFPMAYSFLSIVRFGVCFVWFVRCVATIAVNTETAQAMNECCRKPLTTAFALAHNGD
jgi:hypothetical protein